jgi:hypothetical protein
MNAKEKAIELYNKFRNDAPVLEANYKSKRRALICIDQIIDNCPIKDYGFRFDSISSRLDESFKYWEQVKEEMKKL